VTFSSYGVFAGLGCAAAVLWLRRHRHGLGVSGDEFWAAMWTLLLAGVVGAKALFAVLGFEHYARGELRFFADFRVGFVFFGGLAGAGLAGFVFARVRGLDFLRGADYFGVAIPIGHAIGRIGCFFEGCCHGKPPHPVQLYEAAGLALLAGAVRVVLGRVEAGALPRGAAFRAYLFGYGALRLLLDPLRGDGRPERFLGLSHQQGIALALIAIAAVWLPGLRRRRAPGPALARPS
jgi:phosphatidylglycerol:prolipoprotein diacylglycerol transferase